jgi:hypothetical protein
VAAFSFPSPSKEEKSKNVVKASFFFSLSRKERGERESTSAHKEYGSKKKGAHTQRRASFPRADLVWKMEHNTKMPYIIGGEYPARERVEGQQGPHYIVSHSHWCLSQQMVRSQKQNPQPKKEKRRGAPPFSFLGKATPACAHTFATRVLACAGSPKRALAHQTCCTVVEFFSPPPSLSPLPEKRGEGEKKKVSQFDGR